MGSDRFSSHHHSVSDGAVSFEDSPPDIQGSQRWTSPLQKFKDDEVAGSLLRGSRSVASPYSRPHKRFSVAKAAVRSPSFSSPSPLSEFATLRASRHSFRGRHFSGRRSYTSKAVYPMVFDNPVSDREVLGDPDAACIGRLTPEISPSYWLESRPKFRPGLSESQKIEASPEVEASLRREGFRWSSASSYDLVGYNGEQHSDSGDQFDVLNTILSPCDCSCQAQKCGICGKFLWQKSPWSSNRILRGNDMPIAGVLPCSHVFHADCLEHLTPKTQICEPPCPSCQQFVGQPPESSTIRESLQMALKSLGRNRGDMLTDALQARDDEGTSQNEHRSERKWGRVIAQWKIGGSLKSPFRRRSFKGTTVNL
ncbi:hypothetical protein MLD38_007687 [Melastoma candidum]|uniref:Uncharacterized protein n=1 Tax=Melastoma candidum TaxID=119954 RepID=A0ACB9RRV5_9MYRT|nr:hypothetical protein MLD38_007687 [Melastoma candidum]